MYHPAMISPHDLGQWAAYTWHGGYNLISGPVADLPMLGIFLVLFKKHNCHVKGCPRLQWKPFVDADGHTHVLCKKHHPHDPPNAAQFQ